MISKIGLNYASRKKISRGIKRIQSRIGPEKNFLWNHQKSQDISNIEKNHPAAKFAPNVVPIDIGCSAQCVLCAVYFSAQTKKLRPILKFEKYYPNEHIFVPVIFKL